MHSELFQIGPFTLRAYGLCMALGFLLGWQAAARLCKRTGQDTDRLASLLTWMMLASVIGARAAYVMEHAKPGDLAITMGCGDVNKCAKMMLKYT